MSKDAGSDRPPTGRASKIDWQPLRVLALKTPYTMEYLSLMARRKQLKVKKVGRLWYTTLDNIREFEKEMQARKEKKREKMKAKYFRKDEKPPTKIRVSQAAIFDQIQNELEEVLEEIREKERRLRDEYQEGIARIPLTVAMVGDPKAQLRKKKAKELFLSREKKETEDLSEKLIMDLGKLLNTANQIQEDVDDSSINTNKPLKLAENREPERESEEYQIPIRNRFGDIAAPAERASHLSEKSREDQSSANGNHTPFLSSNYPDHRYPQGGNLAERFDYDFPPARKKTSWGMTILIFFIVLLITVAILLSLLLFLPI